MTHLTPKKIGKSEFQKHAFVGALRETPNVSLACRRAGMSRETAYQWRRIDEEFSRSWDNALEDGIDSLEAEAIRRAKKTSDVLMIFLLKAHRPEKYREHWERDIKNDPGVKAIVKGFMQTLKEFVPQEHFQSAVKRFGILSGFKTDNEEMGISGRTLGHQA